ncbi:WecB/TagA/CpsF family glycosyltransferase [uncultured Williamsia sp.]|uniref:WecB/TagA/CpsF family glycosyltransferase n=1 Tax=uncultured Williamsia sp. TaxID=259311 RepID=UPI00261ECF2D|nr:WecB/TagA/CpsF family glycosyltransferase [uncultured Williamsia sp.]
MTVTLPPKKIQLLGVTVDALDHSEALRTVEKLVARPTTDLIAFANAHLLNTAWRNSAYQTALAGHALVLNDGIGVSMAARMYGFEFPVNLNGTDFSPAVLAMAAERGWRVAFIGSPPGVAENAARVLAGRIPGLNVVATHHGFVDDAQSMTVADGWADADIDLLLVGMGCPRQELWAARFSARCGASVTMSIGAFFDFASGTVPRAPELVRDLHLEWLYRLRQEPRRLFRRYVLGNPVFLYRAVLCRLRLQPSRHSARRA